MSQSHGVRLRQWFTVIFMLSVTLQPAMPIGGTASWAISAPTTVEAPAMPQTASAVHSLLSAPNVLQITAAGFQPDLLQITAGQTLTITNNDTRSRTIRLGVPKPFRVFLPVMMRSGTGLSINLAWPTSLQAPIDESITLAAGQSVTRTLSAIGNVIVSDAVVANVAPATILVTPPAQETIGSVTGLVRDYQTKAPIAAARVTTIESPTLQTTSDTQGKYLLPLPPGNYTLVVFANGYTFANRKVTVQSFTPVAVEPLELVPLDPVVAPISAAGGVVTNSLGNTSVVFSPGAVTSTKAIRLTQLPVDAASQNLAALPGAFVNGEMPLGFVSFEPDGTVFSAPVTWTIVYTGSLPIGYFVPCYYWLEKEARWGEPVSGHVVDLGNGQKGLQAVLPHFSDYGFAPPPPPGLVGP
jgi:plastocyanin